MKPSVSEFRFLVVCKSVVSSGDDCDLKNVVDHIYAEPDDTTDLIAAIGVVLVPNMAGKLLDLMAFRVDKNLEPQRLPEWVGTPIALPRHKGATVLPVSISVPFFESGIHGFYLFDRNGAFGAKESLLATYLFSVSLPNVP